MNQPTNAGRRSDTQCGCGCGEYTDYSTRTWAKYGMVKGQPLRFRKGHNNFIADDRVIVDADTGCWNFQRNILTSSGYGRIRVDDRWMLAHRASFIFANGPLPPQAWVLHRCDNPACVNPEHLFAGTNLDNIADMVAKRRHIHGERHHRAKLTEQDVLDIRTSFARGEQRRPIAERHGITIGHVKDVVHGRVWKHVGGAA